MQFISEEDLNTWILSNNIVIEKNQLFFDFCLTLFNFIKTTYLGNKEVVNETSIVLTENDNFKHFEWCWRQTIELFKYENIIFNSDGNHLNFFYNIFNKLYYLSDKITENNIELYFTDLFNLEIPFTEYELNKYIEIYKVLDTNLNICNILTFTK